MVIENKFNVFPDTDAAQFVAQMLVRAKKWNGEGQLRLRFPLTTYREIMRGDLAMIAEGRDFIIVRGEEQDNA